ncbi:intracellular septation protein A [Beggiatoa sp. PS]|nr:intracellular septation protein A [Beggiatoa sp. PS]
MEKSQFYLGGFFMAMGAINLYVAFNFDEDTWVNFKLFGMMGLTIAFVIGQSFYLAKHIVQTETPSETDKEQSKQSSIDV